MDPRAIKIMFKDINCINTLFKGNIQSNISLILLCLALHWIWGKAAIL